MHNIALVLTNPPTHNQACTYSLVPGPTPDVHAWGVNYDRIMKSKTYWSRTSEMIGVVKLMSCSLKEY